MYIYIYIYIYINIYIYIYALYIHVYDYDYHYSTQAEYNRLYTSLDFTGKEPRVHRRADLTRTQKAKNKNTSNIEGPF